MAVVVVVPDWAVPLTEMGGEGVGRGSVMVGRGLAMLAVAVVLAVAVTLMETLATT